MTIWTYARIDHELLRDDSNSATDILPVWAWTSKEPAIEAAERSEKEDWINEDGELDEDYKPLIWETENSRGDMTAYNGSCTFIVYKMEVEQPPQGEKS